MLEDLEGFLHSLMMKIGYSGEGLSEILSSDAHEFPKNVRKYMTDGLDIPEAWHKAADDFWEECDRCFVAGIIDDFGREGPEEELDRTNRNLLLCRELIDAAVKNMSTKGRSEAMMPLYISVISVLVLM